MITAEISSSVLGTYIIFCLVLTPRNCCHPADSTFLQLVVGCVIRRSCLSSATIIPCRPSLFVPVVRDYRPYCPPLFGLGRCVEATWWSLILVCLPGGSVYLVLPYGVSQSVGRVLGNKLLCVDGS